jgi:hypothetical protein
LVDLVGLCRRNGWDDPEIKDIKTNKGYMRQMVVNTGTKKLTRVGVSSNRANEAENDGAQKLLDAMPELFESSADRQAVAADKQDRSTPIGLLYAVASENDLGEPHLRIRNNMHFTHVRATLKIDDDIDVKGSSDDNTYESERVVINQAAQRLLEKLKAGEYSRLFDGEVPSVPEPVEETSVIPRGYLVSPDPLKELRLLCIEQGHEPPEYSIVPVVGKNKRKRIHYTCTVHTKEGDTIIKKATCKNAHVSLSMCGAYMLQHLRPQYRGNALYIRKVDMLREQHEEPITPPEFSEEPLAVKDKSKEVPNVHKCALSHTGTTQPVEGAAIRPLPHLAHDAACRWLLEILWIKEKSARYRKKHARRRIAKAEKKSD